QKVVRANKHYTAKDDGLKQNWIADAVFINPPYSNIRFWIDKAISENHSGNAKEIIFLTHADTSTKWFRAAMRACSAVCFYGRIKFNHTDKTIGAGSTNGTLFFYFGRNPEKFISVFGNENTLAIRNTWLSPTTKKR